MSEEIKNRIKRVLIEKIDSELLPDNINDDTPLIELGVGVDSVATLELIVALESEFKIIIDESEISPGLLENVDSIANYVNKRIRNAV